jgi:16S rRNA (cytidine1402-2'-O)-methyltransferase
LTGKENKVLFASFAFKKKKRKNHRRCSMAGTLYLVPTPIGNLGDLSQRVIDTLAEADFIAAEDTRVSLKILNHLGLKKPLVSYYRHNTETSGPAILERLRNGENCALVTDAGMPAISDPGEELVKLCAEAGVDVVAIPGPCALVTALAVSGLPTGRFTFEGFLAMNKKNRKRHLASLKQEERTMIFYEAPHKLTATLEDLAETFGPDRRVALCRELTKLHEEVRRTTLGEAADYYRANSPKGEFVLVVEGGAPQEEETITPEEGAERVLRLRAEQGLSLKDAAKQVAKATGLSKNVLYDLAGKLSDLP